MESFGRSHFRIYRWREPSFMVGTFPFLTQDKKKHGVVALRCLPVLDRSKLKERIVTFGEMGIEEDQGTV